MECYKLTVMEDRFGSKSSRQVIMKIMREVCKQVHKTPNAETGVMFAETASFPKEYYFNTLDKTILKILVSNWKVEKGECPSLLIQEAEQFHYLGNRELISPKPKAK
jgi:hypothetical protein